MGKLAGLDPDPMEPELSRKEPMETKPLAIPLWIGGMTLCLALAAPAQSWPTYNHGPSRNALAAESPGLPLKVAWVHAPRLAPRPAWPDPAPNDFWHRKHNLAPRVIYDRAFHLVAAGGRVYFGSSADDQVHCLELATGREVWTFFTGAPVRLSPTLWEGKVYFGSDDGRVYCLDAATGKLLWKVFPAPKKQLVIGNRRMISLWPIRTGVVVDRGKAFFCSGLFPQLAGVSLCCLDAETGKEVWKVKTDISAQGYILASRDRLFVPTGRTAPVAFDKRTGKKLASIPSSGGGYAVVEDDLVAAGPGDTTGTLTLTDARTKRKLVSFQGLHLVSRKGIYYIHGRTGMFALDRNKYIALLRKRMSLEAQKKKASALLKKKGRNSREGKKLRLQVGALAKEIARLNRAMKKCFLWNKPCREPYGFLVAGDLLFTGGEGRISAWKTSSGRKVWSAPVEGRAYAMAVAQGRLLVSTSKGKIYCFAKGARPAGTAPGPKPEKPGSSPSPADPALESFLGRVLPFLPPKNGWCLVLGLSGPTAPLARLVAQKTRLQVLILEKDPVLAAQARKALARAGLYGNRAAVLVGSLEDTILPPYFADLVLGGWAKKGGLPSPPGRVLRCLRPWGGLLALGLRPGTDGGALSRPAAWKEKALAGGRYPEIKEVQLPPASDAVKEDILLLRRGPLPGEGEWTEGLCDPGNTACTMDRRVAGPLDLQWFGRPGPRKMADRHHRNPPPLFKAGRLFIPGDRVYFCVDPYNGAPLWEVRVPGSRRLGVFLDCSNIAVDDKFFYVAAGPKLHRYDVATGREAPPFKIPRILQGRHAWEYISLPEGILLGSIAKEGAAYKEMSYQGEIPLWKDHMAIVTSEALFCMDRKGRLKWKYRKGAILNTTLTSGEGKVYFIESEAKGALASKTGRATMEVLRKGKCFLTALDLERGRKVWRHPLDMSEFQILCYLEYAKGRLLLSGNHYIKGSLWYFFRALDPASGKVIWEQSEDTGFRPGGEHGEQNRHPTLVGNWAYTWPFAYRLSDGKRRKGWRFSRHGHGCGGVSASAYTLFWRGGNPWCWDIRPGGGPFPLNRVNRPGCWINMIPAGGMLLVPEASSGCTCGFPLQTSMAYVPKELKVFHDPEATQ